MIFKHSKFYNVSGTNFRSSSKARWEFEFNSFKKIKINVSFILVRICIPINVRKLVIHRHYSFICFIHYSFICFWHELVSFLKNFWFFLEIFFKNIQKLIKLFSKIASRIAENIYFSKKTRKNLADTIPNFDPDGLET